MPEDGVQYSRVDVHGMNEVGVGQGGEVCYFDGSKEVCNNKLLKKYCAFVGEEWGLRDVYC